MQILNGDHLLARFEGQVPKFEVTYQGDYAWVRVFQFGVLKVQLNSLTLSECLFDSPQEIEQVDSVIGIAPGMAALLDQDCRYCLKQIGPRQEQSLVKHWPQKQLYFSSSDKNISIWHNSMQQLQLMRELVCQQQIKILHINKGKAFFATDSRIQEIDVEKGLIRHCLQLGQVKFITSIDQNCCILGNNSVSVFDLRARTRQLDVPLVWPQWCQSEAEFECGIRWGSRYLLGASCGLLFLDLPATRLEWCFYQPTVQLIASSNQLMCLGPSAISKMIFQKG